MRAILIVTVTLLGSGTLALGQSRAEEDMLMAASALTKVVAAAEATARYANLPDGVGDEEFLGLATAHDPMLLAPLSGYRLKAFRKDRHAIVLVCDPERDIALLEDIGCTAEMDRHGWRDVPPPPCTPSIDVAAACSRAP